MVKVRVEPTPMRSASTQKKLFVTLASGRKKNNPPPVIHVVRKDKLKVEVSVFIWVEPAPSRSHYKIFKH